jgi:hypothetical protein
MKEKKGTVHVAAMFVLKGVVNGCGQGERCRANVRRGRRTA